MRFRVRGGVGWICGAGNCAGSCDGAEKHISGS